MVADLDSDGVPAPDTEGLLETALPDGERWALLRPLVPSLCAKVTPYPFHASRRDRDRGLLLDSPRVVPG